MQITSYKSCLIVISTLFLFPVFSLVQAQEPDVTALMEAMDKNRDEATAGEKKEDGYKSFVQNE